MKSRRLRYRTVPGEDPQEVQENLTRTLPPKLTLRFKGFALLRSALAARATADHFLDTLTQHLSWALETWPLSPHLLFP